MATRVEIKEVAMENHQANGRQMPRLSVNQRTQIRRHQILPIQMHLAHHLADGHGPNVFQVRLCHIKFLCNIWCR